MKRFLPAHFEELKRKLLEKAGIQDISPSDCYRLSVDISTTTQKRISETTLKRIFGFAESRYNPSSFTLNAMAEFCGFEGWSAYMSHLENFQGRNVSTHSWQSVSQTAHKITRFTLETNKQKSGIPFEHTISRGSLNRHINLFENTAANVCLVSGHAGSGKTIGLTHWIDQQLTLSLQENSQDIYLFINSYSLLQVAGYGYDGSRWLAQILDMQKKDEMYEFLRSFEKQAPGKFYLIIDDLNNHFFNDKHFNLIINQLIDMSAYFSAFSWFKFILSTRPGTWQLYKHLIEGSRSLYANWYTGFSPHTAREAVNMLPFSIDEIYQLTYQLTGRKSMPSEGFRKQYQFIKLPVYYQYYYQLRGKDIDPAILSSADQYAIASPYINKHVLKGIRNTEKQVLTNQLFNQAYFRDTEICINKENIYYLIKQHHTAYKELLQSGVLYEYHTDSKYSNLTEIRVQSPLLGTYFLAKNLLSSNNYTINGRLIELINQQVYPESIRISMLRWLIIFSLESGELTFVNELIKRSFGTVDENHFTIFCYNSISNIGTQNIENHYKLNDQLNNSPFIEYALLYPGLQQSYVRALKQLLRFSLSEKNKIYIHSKLGLIAFLQLDDTETSQQIDILRGLSSTTLSSLAVNPLHGLETLHHYFRYGTVNIEAIYELTQYCFNPQKHQAGKQHELILIIALCCGILTNNPKKVIRFINAIQSSLQKNPSTVISQDFGITMQLFRTLELLRAGEPQKAATNISRGPRMNTHKFNQVLEKIIRVLIGQSPYPDSTFQITHLLGIVRHEHMTLFEAYIRQFLVYSGYDLSENEVKEHKLALKQISKKTNYRLEALKEWQVPSKGAGLPVTF